jgi:hypothetical protein
MGIAGLMVIIFVFTFGVFVGERKANFSFKWADQYHRNFAGPKEGFLKEFINTSKGTIETSNGCFGEIISIEKGSITIKDMNDVERKISVDEKTSIVFQRKKIELADIKIGDHAVILGEPTEEGQIKAGLIRIMPPPPVSSINKRMPI